LRSQPRFGTMVRPPADDVYALCSLTACSNPTNFLARRSQGETPETRNRTKPKPRCRAPRGCRQATTRTIPAPRDGERCPQQALDGTEPSHASVVEFVLVANHLAHCGCMGGDLASIVRHMGLGGFLFGLRKNQRKAFFLVDPLD
jgi:hypothetical protein